MYRQLVDGKAMPARIGGDPSIDFCNTWAGWGDPVEHREYLLDYDHLVAWAHHAGLVGPATADRLRREGAAHPDEAARCLAAALRFRQDLYTVLSEGAAAPQAAIERVGAAATRAHGARRLVHADGAWTWSVAHDLGLPLRLVAASAAQLLTGEGSRSVRRCAGRGCGWLFTDPTGRRRWCSMATCGNRAKVAAFAQRRKHAGRHRRGRADLAAAR